MIAWLIALLVALVGLFYWLTGDSTAFAGLDSVERWGLIAGMVIMAFYVLILFSGYEGRWRQAAGYLAIWFLLGLSLVAGYAYRGEISVFTNRIAGELLPPGEGVTINDATTGDASVRIRRRADGHFIARGQVNGQRLVMLVDTGASTVVLRPADARRAGIDTGALSYSIAVQTANGTAYAAPIRLNAISIGPIVVRNVEALVAKPGSLNENLLGMSFLRRLRSYEFSGDFLTLRS